VSVSGFGEDRNKLLKYKKKTPGTQQFLNKWRILLRLLSQLSMERLGQWVITPVHMSLVEVGVRASHEDLMEVDDNSALIVADP
jgi:hypothetical protein